MDKKKESSPRVEYPFSKTLLLVGMMGCGKTSIAYRLAKTYNMPFIDVDEEIVKAAGCDISDLFSLYGEEEFRRGEERVMNRLLSGDLCVLASGGGSFLSEKTRSLAKEKAVSVFLDADVTTLIRNTKGRAHRPLLNGDNPEKIIMDLLAKRRETYEQADVHITYKDETPNQIVQKIIFELRKYAGKVEK